MAPGPGFEPRFEAPQAPVIPDYTIRAHHSHWIDVKNMSTGQREYYMWDA